MLSPPSVVAEQSHCTFTFNFNRYDKEHGSSCSSQSRAEPVPASSPPPWSAEDSWRRVSRKKPLPFGTSPGFWTAHPSHPSGQQPDFSLSQHSVTVSFTISIFIIWKKHYSLWFSACCQIPSLGALLNLLKEMLNAAQSAIKISRD